MAVPIHKLERFMRESNAIEGELEDSFVMTPAQLKWGFPIGKLNANDIEVAKIASHAALKNVNPDEKTLLHMHALVSQDSDLMYKGCWRGCDVTVGSFKPPRSYAIPNLMTDYLANWKNYDTFEAHAVFEKIHPFEDYNGRMGRLLWMWKALQKHDGWYTFSLPFLHRYYYETLQHFEQEWRRHL